jgi:hypothetical protein
MKRAWNSFFAPVWLVGLLAASVVSAQPAELNERPNERVVRAESPIVAGNAVTAKKRALADAFRQAAERSLAELMSQGDTSPGPLPAGVAQLKASLANAAQRFIRSYRLLEQENENGILHVMVEADVDTVLLRRELERARGAATPVVPAPVAKPAADLVLVAGPLPAGVAPMLVGALTASGLKAQLDPAPAEAQLAVSVAKQNAYGLFAVAKATTEGIVRGAGRISVKCSVSTRLFQAGTQGPRGPAVDRNDEDRGFAADEGAARTACFERVAGTVARAVTSAMRAPTVAAAFVTLQLDVVEPGAIPIILQALKRLGAVTASEVRHVTAAMAEIRVFTRIGGPALQQVLVREVGNKLAMVPTRATVDRLEMQVRNVDSSSIEENR